MMEHNLPRPPGARKPRKRVGRGDAAGQGSYAGRGMKGQKSRSGKPPRPGFEGGQNPLVKGLPTRRGFVNIFKVKFSLVKLEHLKEFPAGSQINPESLLRHGLVRNPRLPIKVLGGAELDGPIAVAAHKFTRSARQQIEAAGGTVEELKAR